MGCGSSVPVMTKEEEEDRKRQDEFIKHWYINQNNEKIYIPFYRGDSRGRIFKEREKWVIK